MPAPVMKPLLPHHLAGARLFGDRFQQIVHIRELMDASGLAGPSVLEIGVGFGFFSKFLIQALAPSRFAGVDLFQFHTYEDLWGINVQEQLKGRLHVDYYRDELSAMFDGELLIEAGDSAEMVGRFEDDSFDLIYIDAGHAYADVIRDTRASLTKVRKGGYLVFNDYIMTDHLGGVEYGVIHAANEIINERDDLTVIGFAFDPQMFCDLAVKVAQ